VIDKHLAHHEAAHAVMAIRQGQEPDVLAVEGDGGFYLGGGEDHIELDVFFEPQRDADLVAEARKAVLTILAGWAGAKAAGFARPSQDCGYDFKNAGLILRAQKFGSLKRWKRRALAIMKRRENMRAVAKLAACLQASSAGWLTGSEVVRIVACADAGD
jgi:hypothetical protein